MRNLKFKKRPFWRLDKFRLNNIIENGGWHFCNLKTVDELLYKYNNLCETNDPYVFKEKIDKKYLDLKEIKKRSDAGLDIIAFLLSAYPDSFDMKDNYGCTPFKYVFVNKNVKKKSKVIKWMTDFATKKTLINSFQYLAAQSNELIPVLNEDTSRPQGKTTRSIYPAGKNSKNDKSLSSPRKTK